LKRDIDHKGNNQKNVACNSLHFNPLLIEVYHQSASDRRHEQIEQRTRCN
jgi:hypothetical protein